jgi:uncharacterized protein YcbX
MSNVGELIAIDQFPLTGARAVPLDEAALGPAGLTNDRQYVLYDATEPAPAHKYNERPPYVPDTYARVSQRQEPGLAQLTATYGEPGGLYVWHDNTDILEINLMRDPAQAYSIFVGEFGDSTPCVDAGDDAADFFCSYLGREGIRLARKTDGWMSGEGVLPKDRANAPLHIVSADSVDALQGEQDVYFGHDRFRPGLVATSVGAIETRWIGRVIRIGEAYARVTRATERCPVPGTHQRTGENRKDVPRLYRGFPRGPNGKPAFGVYAYPLLEPDKERPVIRQGDEIELTDRTAA